MNYLRLIAVAVLLVACDSDKGVLPAEEFDQAREAERAEAVVRAFAGELQAKLMQAMQMGGPVAAISVCNTEAIDITRKVGNEHGLKLARVSLRYRNPDNDPNTWQALVLQDFEFRLASGENPAGIAWSEVVKAGNVRQFRFMKAIPASTVCLQCHGSELAPGVSEVLAELYPNDRATGFSEGDLRGAFVVTQKVGW